jgi:hypothetical protein
LTEGKKASEGGNSNGSGNGDRGDQGWEEEKSCASGKHKVIIVILINKPNIHVHSLSTQSAPKKPKAAFPSGLVRDWKSKVKASAHKTGSTQKNEPSSTSSVVLGGLGDDGAFSVQPPGKKRDLKRSNEVRSGINN